MRYMMSNGAEVDTRALGEDGELDAHREIALDGNVIGWLYGARDGVWYGETRDGEPINQATSYGVVREAYRHWSGDDVKVTEVKGDDDAGDDDDDVAHYVVTYASAGCLPDDVESVHVTVTAREAWDYVADEIELIDDDGDYLAAHTALHAIDRDKVGSIPAGESTLYAWTVSEL